MVSDLLIEILSQQFFEFRKSRFRVISIFHFFDRKMTKIAQNTRVLCFFVCFYAAMATSVPFNGDAQMEMGENKTSVAELKSELNEEFEKDLDLESRNISAEAKSAERKFFALNLDAEMKPEEREKQIDNVVDTMSDK